jgi:phenylacetic acid degradation protein
MSCFSYDSIRPVVGQGSFVHPAAVLIGDVIIGAGCYVGPGASLRGDLGRIIVEDGTNVQDNCVMHSFPGEDCVVERDGHIGHGAILHGCRVCRGALVGMGTIVMDGAIIGQDAIIGAAAFLPARFVVPDRMLALGSPAKLVRPVSDAEIEWKNQGGATYRHLAARSIDTLVQCDPLAEVEGNRGRVQAPLHQPLYKTR